jgi:hypothetical protein
LVQALDATALSQYDTTPQTTFYTPTYFFTNSSVPPHYPEANLYAREAAPWDMTMTGDGKAGKIDIQGVNNIDRDGNNDEENGGRYVVWDGYGLSLIRGFNVGRSRLIAANILSFGQDVQVNLLPTISGPVHQRSAASIPELSDRSQHLALPIGADIHLVPASDTDITSVRSRQGASAGPIRQQSSNRNHGQALQRIYDKPGRKLPVTFEPSLSRMQELSRQRGGQDFAIAWIAKAFTNGVTKHKLARTLSEQEINAVDHDHGFPLSQAYDGFLEKVEDRFACGLCHEEKQANWKHKKDSIRHLQKFHFGIGESCGSW